MLKLLKRKRRAPIAVLTLGATMVLVVMMAIPAAAAAGDGFVLTGEFSDDADSTNPPATCGGSVSNTEMSWSQVGDWTATSGTTTHVFTGVTNASLTSTGDYAFGPAGSYQPGGPCLPPPPLGPAPGYDVGGTTVSVSSASGAVSCPSLTGTFDRTGVSTVTVSVSGNCTVKVMGNSVTENVDVIFSLNVVAVPATEPPYPIASGTYTEL